MDIFSICVFMTALAGFSMVIGGMLLIYKGAIVLSAQDSSQALSIEWKQDFRMSTQVPGLAFFIIGLFFSVIAIVASKPSRLDPISIAGQIDESVTEPVTITASPAAGWTVNAGNGRKIEGRIFPDVDVLSLQVSAPGYAPKNFVYNLTGSKEKQINIAETITLERRIPVIVGHQRNIVSPAVPLAPLNAPPQFGGAR